MFVLLVKVRLLSLWNVARHSAARHKLLSALLTCVGSALCIAIFAGFLFFLRLGGGLQHGTQELIYDLFYFLLLFLFAGAVPFVASTLLHSADYLLLSAAPIRPRTVIAAKLLDATVTNCLQFTVIGIPAIAACGVALNLPLAGWPVLLLIVALFVLLPALATALLLLLALALFGMRRVRGAIATVNVLLATVVCLTIVMQINQLPIHQSLNSMLSTPPPISARGAAHAGPSAWFANSLISISKGEWGVGLAQLGWIALLIAVLYTVCMALGGKMISAASTAEEGEGQAAALSGGAISNRRRLPAWIPAQLATLVVKDLKYVVRDSVLLGQLGMPVILFFVPLAMATQPSLRSMASLSELYVVSVGMTSVVVFMQTSILSLSSIGLENRGFWIVLTAPCPGRRLVIAKFIMSTVVSGGVGVILSILDGLLFSAPPLFVLIQSLMTVLIAIGLCGMGVGISAALPRFVYENPAHRVSVWALILGFFGSVAYVIISGTLFVVLYLLVSQTEGHAMLFYGVGTLFFLGLTVVCAVVPMEIGAKRLDAYQWEH
jgi:ABC-2 type transport system permease protein